jgi:hypothetical protein
MSIPKKVRDALHERAGDCCEMCGRHGANNAHHRRNKSQGGRDVLSNLLLLCGSGVTGCHGWVTGNPQGASVYGLTIMGTASVPADVRVWRGNDAFGTMSGRYVRLTDDGSVVPAPQTSEAS